VPRVRTTRSRNVSSELKSPARSPPHKGGVSILGQFLKPTRAPQRSTYAADRPTPDVAFLERTAKATSLLNLPAKLKIERDADRHFHRLAVQA